MFIAHGPISYLANEKIQEKEIKKLDTQSYVLVTLLTLLFGILPDFDMFIQVMLQQSVYNHHSLFTHSITFWVLLWIVIRVLLMVLRKSLKGEIKAVFNSNLLTVISNSFLIGTVSHILADSIFSPMRFFYPLEYRFTLLGNVLQSNLFSGYFFSFAMAVEIVILVLFLVYIYRKFFRKNSLASFGLYSLMTLSVLYLSFSLFVNVNTYNFSSHMSNGVKIYDADLDTVMDRRDFDTDNNFVNNIEDVDHSLLTQDILDIVNREPLASSKKSVLGNIYYKLGAFDSYRVVSQAYFNQNKSLEPVLDEFARVKYGSGATELDVKYAELLYEYFLDSGRLVSVNDIQGNLSSGRILFVQDMDGELVNMGVVLEDEKVCIVFENDERLAVHSFSEVRDLYKGGLLYIQI